MLGATVNHEPDGLPTPGADRDDVTDRDDEDAVDSPVVIALGRQAHLPVTVTNTSDSDATLAGWIGLDHDGELTDDERRTAVVPASSGTSTVTLSFPEAQRTGETYARLRIMPTVDESPSPVGRTTTEPPPTSNRSCRGPAPWRPARPSR
ncbi:hypothetical protein BLA60_15045 [Actinophytocola xinjiangensis]|uniref:GEVED domain-containing protein n=1 Tax=Actinophytocola xinjiangensis TaxID=485602 RepID=A0A7Z1AXK9_9PSEU|nr:GEVED domain-containing protein [Actinophytocola xinjiangensis]OLF10504.1 hypothetical protein BLA60_15045 [Actinophytocola xinjiangensis]